MPISVKEVLKISHLCRLELEEEEVKRFTEELSKILDYFKKLQTLDTEKVSPTFHAVKLRTLYREDEVEPFEHIDEILANAPRLYERMIVVPKVVKTF